MLLPFLAVAAIPPAERAAVLAPIEAAFAAIAAHDPEALRAQTFGQGGATIATEQEDGSVTVRQASWAQLAQAIQPGTEQEEEKLGDTILRIDGDIAMVWARYTFRIDGIVHHCGVDHFQLARMGGAWKIANLAWTVRTRCEAEKPVVVRRKRR